MIQDHFGHNPDISEKNYRKSLPLVELTKVAKALLLAEQGKILDHKGKLFEKLTALEVEPKGYEDELDDVENYFGDKNNESKEEFSVPSPK